MFRPCSLKGKIFTNVIKLESAVRCLYPPSWY